MNIDREDMTEAETEFCDIQNQLISKFKNEMEKVFKEIVITFYTDATPFALADMDINYRQVLQESLTRELAGDLIKSKHLHSWATNFRRDLYREYKEELRSAIIDDLKLEVERLNEIIDQLRKRY